MKLIFSTLTILALALSAAQAQEQDSTLISERTEGNYLIRRYRLTSPNEEAQYRLNYRI